jgi:hypothetical protein
MNNNYQFDSDVVSVWENYGPFQDGHKYKLVKINKDSCVLKCRGKNIQVPKDIVNFYPKTVAKNPVDTVEDEFFQYLDDYDMDGV